MAGFREFATAEGSHRNDRGWKRRNPATLKNVFHGNHTGWEILYIFA
jgi:hypothetical protein